MLRAGSICWRHYPRLCRQYNTATGGAAIITVAKNGTRGRCPSGCSTLPRGAKAWRCRRCPQARLGNQARRISGGGIPNKRQADHGSKKAGDQNVQGVVVGVGHSILHQHEEILVPVSDSRCGVSHVTNAARKRTKQKVNGCSLGKADRSIPPPHP